MAKQNFKNKAKTRNLSYYKYFEQLQLEYIIAEFRKKIYPSTKDKQYYERVMKGKRDIIDDISIRNSLKSIFTDKNTKIEKYNQIFNKIGYPNIFYRDERDRENFESKDKIFYYMSGSEFRININGEEKIGVLIFASFKTNTATIRFEKQEEEDIFDLNYLTRIL